MDQEARRAEEAEAARRAAAVNPVDEVGAAIKARLRGRTLAVARETAPKPRPPGLRGYLGGSPSRMAVAVGLVWWHPRQRVYGVPVGPVPFGVEAWAPDYET